MRAEQDRNRTPRPDVDIDHTSYAVRDDWAWARRLRRELSAVPIAGEVVGDYRYLLLHVGSAERGRRVELLSPVRTGFLTRFLDAHGEGPHHVTFQVADLGEAVAGVRALGLTVVGEFYGHPAWQEAFVLPGSGHGTVVQLARSDRVYPSPAELLATTDRDPAAYPSAAGSSDRQWWVRLWDEPAGTRSPAAPARLASSDLGVSRALFGEVLAGAVEEVDGGLSFGWPSGALEVLASVQDALTGGP